MEAVFTAKELADRWKCHVNTIRVMEDQGKLHRLEDIPGVRYSAEEVLQLECLGSDAQPLTAWERKKLEARIHELERIVKDYQAKMNRITLLCQID